MEKVGKAIVKLRIPILIFKRIAAHSGRHRICQDKSQL